MFRGQSVTILNLFEAVGAHAAGKITDADLRELEGVACPGPGACGGQFTANTMAMALEFLGLSPMGSASVAATEPAKDEVGEDAGRLGDGRPAARRPPAADRHARRDRERHRRRQRHRRLDERGAAPARDRPRSRRALTIDDFDPIGRRTPLWADMQPGGSTARSTWGMPAGRPSSRSAWWMPGWSTAAPITVTGRTFAEEAGAGAETPGQDVVWPLDGPSSRAAGSSS